MILKGGRRDIFLGTRECQAYVMPCEFGSGDGYYDDVERLTFGLMYHGITYADEAWSSETRDQMTVNMFRPVMEKGIIRYPRPDECEIHKTVRPMKPKQFDMEHSEQNDAADGR